MTPRCSVILPTYNRLATLPRAVASVLAQDMPDFELLIIDDGSTDATGEWLAEQRDPRVRVHQTERNAGPSVARNRGLKEAKGAVAAFLDSDDVYRPNRLSRTLAVFDAEPDVHCILSSSLKRNRSRTDPLILPDLKLAPALLEWGLVCDLIAVETSSVTLRTQSARAAGGFCESLKRSEDREFLIRLARQGAGRLMSDLLWEKIWSDDGLSQERLGAGRDLVAYAHQRPEYLARYRKVGSYLATKILVADLRRRDIATFAFDWSQFRAAGLISGDIAEMIRAHTAVRRYRRAYANSPALATLAAPPADWT
jgi:glycosyltransferase involved in cell wall biosynthesis